MRRPGEVGRVKVGTRNGGQSGQSRGGWRAGAVGEEGELSSRSGVQRAERGQAGWSACGLVGSNAERTGIDDFLF